MRRCIIAAVLLLFARPASAQVVTGRVVDASTGAPLPGAFVALLNEQQMRITGTLTAGSGEFSFRVAPGTYTVRVERIGHATTGAGPFQLQPQETRTLRLPMEVAALRLKEIDIRGENRCERRPDASRRTAVIWDEARKALTVAAWTQTGGAFFQTRNYEVELGADLEPIRSPRYRFANFTGTRTYRSAPADTLARYGYIRRTGDDTLVFGPDAELLLSNSFLNLHCFRVERRRDRPGLIGLGFEPVRGRRLVDIAGTLWLDEATAHLRFIEYGYTGSGFTDPRYSGGRIEFELLPNGAWIVRRWYIRSPMQVRHARGRAAAVMTAYETGGEVLSAQVRGSDPARLVAFGTIQGLVVDSVSGRPLEGARVYLSGTSHSVVAGPAGRFRFDSIPAGVYGVAFDHAVLDSLPHFPPPVLAQLQPPAVAQVVLATPSGAAAAADVCTPGVLAANRTASRDTATANRGLLFGTVDRHNHRAVTIHLQWRRYTGVQRVRTLRALAFGLAVTPDENGRYYACGLPIDHPIDIELRSGEQLIRRDSVRIPVSGLRRADLSAR